MAKFSVMIEALVGGLGGHTSRQAFEVEGKDENEARTAVLRYYEQTWHPKPGEVKVVKVVKVSNSFQNGRARAEAELAPKLARFGNGRGPKYKVGDRVQVSKRLRHEAAGMTGIVRRVIPDSGIGGAGVPGYDVMIDGLGVEPFGEGELA